MNSKRIGNIGEAVAIAEFTKLGIPVYLPFGDNERADLIAEFDGKLNKIQVKTAEKIDEGTVKFDLTSSTSHRKNGYKHKYTEDEIDYFFCYCIERKTSYLIKVDKPRTAIVIRFEKPLNDNLENINFEEDYLFSTVIKNMNLKDDFIDFEELNKTIIDSISIKRKKNYCKICGKEIMRESKFCKDCYNKERTKNNPSKEELLDMLDTYTPYTLARYYNVDRKTIKRWLIKYELPTTKDGIEKYKLNKNNAD